MVDLPTTTLLHHVMVKKSFMRHRLRRRITSHNLSYSFQCSSLSFLLMMATCVVLCQLCSGMMHSPGIGQLQPISAQLSSTLSTDVGADKCIDGITDGASGVCHSNMEPAPWLALDFGDGASVAVEKVVLYNRGDSNAARTRQVEIRLAEELPTSSTTMFTGGALLGTFPGPAASGQQVDIKSGSNWATQYGRYVVVQMNNNDVLNLAEVVTYGICLFKGKSCEH